MALARDNADVGENDEERAEQNFVGDGIKELTERRPLFESARDKAVQTVGDAGQPKEYERDDPVVIQDFDDEERHGEEPQHRQDVRRRADLSQVAHRGRDLHGI